MEPTNNPQPSTNPEAGAAPEVAADPSVVAAPTVAPVEAAPTATPAEPVVAAVPDLAAAASDLAAAAPDLAAPATPTEAAAPVAAPTDPTAAAGGATVGVPSAPSLNGLPLTEPIMRPDLPPAPDPIKQELEAPMKAAGPVPGSIGSTISVSQDGTQLDANGQPLPANSGQGSVSNVAFNDPAKQADAGQPGAANPAAKKSKAIKFDLKNMNRATLVTLIVIAAMIVIGLVTVLFVQLMA